MVFEISYGAGEVETCSSYREAVEWCEDRWPDAEIGHDGDLTDGGERTLVWASVDDSIDDDGANAVARISPVLTDEEIESFREQAEEELAVAARVLNAIPGALDGDGVAIGIVAMAIDRARIESDEEE